MDYDALPMPSPSTLQRPSLLPQPHRSANMPVSIRVTESASRFVAAAASDTGSDADMNREMRVLMRQIQVQRAGVKGSDALSSVVKERRMENSCEDRRLAASDTEQEGGRLKVLRNTAEESEYRDRFVISRPASVSPQPLRVHPQRFLHPQQGK